MEQKEVRFYKLDKSKRYGAEGTKFKVGEVILLSLVLALFWAVTIAMVVINFKVLFRNVEVTVFIFVFIVILSVITANLLWRTEKSCKSIDRFYGIIHLKI